jgi:hypothetical protein
MILSQWPFRRRIIDSAADGGPVSWSNNSSTTRTVYF